MRHLAYLACICCSAAVLAGCAKRDTDVADTAALADTATGTMAAPAPAAPAAISLSDIAGRWNARSVPVTGDTTPTTFVLTATADTTGWTMTFPNRPPVPMRIVSVGGDSIVAEAGPYSSVRRRGVQVRTHSVMRREGDRLVGTTVARYVGAGADSVLRLNMEATRAP